MNIATAISPSGWFRTLVYLFLFAGVYYSTFEWLVTKDWVREDYSSSFMVPLIVIYLLWELRTRIAETPSGYSWWGVPVIAAGLALFWLGELSGEFFSQYLSSWFVLVGICLLHLGWRRIKIMAFPLLFLLGAFPLPNAVNSQLTLKLKLISSQIGVEMMRLYGLSAFRDGNVIDVGFTRLQVVDACSGLRYFVPLMMLALLLAYYFRGALWKKAFLVGSAVPVSVFTNSLRIASVGILYQFFGPVVAEGFFHDFSGWFIFMASLGMLLAEMWLLRRFMPEAAEAAGERLPQEHPVPACNPHRTRLITAHFVAAVLLLGTTLGFSHMVEFREYVPVNRPLDEFPLGMGEWNGTRTTMGQEFIDVLKFDSYLMVDYADPKGRQVSFYTAYYGSQRKGGSIHSPATCLPGSGWVFEESGAVEMPFTDSAGRPMKVSRAIMKKGDVQELTYYWFPMRGRNLTSLHEMKLFNFWDALTRQRTDGALVRLITPVYGGEGVAGAEVRLQQFTRMIVPELAHFLPR